MLENIIIVRIDHKRPINFSGSILFIPATAKLIILFLKWLLQI